MIEHWYDTTISKFYRLIKHNLTAVVFSHTFKMLFSHKVVLFTQFRSGESLECSGCLYNNWGRFIPKIV